MAKLRIRIELNPGGVGVRFHKLGQVAEEFEKLFRYLAQDVGVSSDVNEWVARDFENGSMICNIELTKPIEDVAVRKYNRALGHLVSFREDADVPDSTLSARTLKQFVSAGKILDSDEAVQFGLYENGGAKPDEFRKMERRPALELERVLDTPVTYVGTVQGKTGTWYKASDYFDLREVLSGEVVKCNYKRDLYPEITRAYLERDAVVHVSGTIFSSRIERRPLEIRVEAIRTYQPLSDDEFRKFYGMAPGLTGDENTPDVLERNRRDADA